MNRILKFLSSPIFILPLVVFVASRFFAQWLALQGNCWAGLGHECWVRWDAGLYLEIAEKGHTLFHCTPEMGYPPNSDVWCGNSGWAPLYPLFVRLVYGFSHGFSFQDTSMNYADSALLVSSFFYLTYLFVCGAILNLKSFGLRSWLLLGICAFAPGNIYFHAAYPIAQVTFFLALVYLFIQKKKYLYAGIAAYFAVLSYSIGFFILIVMGCYALLLMFKYKDEFWSFVFKTCLPAALGLITIMVYDQFATGHWNAMFLIQSKYGHALQSPIKLFGQRWSAMLATPFGWKNWIEVQNLVMVLYIFAMSFFLFRKGWVKPFALFCGLYLFILWFLPYTISIKVALYRNSAILGPAHSRTSELPTWLIGIILLTFLGLSYPLGVSFMFDFLE